MGVALAVLVLLIVNFFYARAEVSGEPITPRLGFFIVLICAFIGVQMLEASPFFLSTTAFIILAYLSMASAPRLKEVTCVVVAGFVFAFGLQTLFTSVIFLDLQTGF